ncbi:MAG: HAMP domain-containing sensor histidine kinase [bacterium]|nr:HAMP domain-containing sensor histidine kinase [bacterium]
MAKKQGGILQNLKLTQKIFFIFVLMIILVINSWAFTLTTVLDFQESFSKVETYAFPSIIKTSQLKDHLHIALLGVYNYINTGDEASKLVYQEQFTEAIRAEYDLFQLSETSTDFIFTQQFNEKLLAIYNTTDELVTTYEFDPTSSDVTEKLSQLNGLRDDFNTFLKDEITTQVEQQITNANEGINSTVQQIQYYLIGVAVIVLLIIIFILIFISNNITKPVAILTKAAEEFGKGKFEKVEIKHNDELGLFAKTFNKMAKDIQSSQKALQEELEKTKELDRQKSEFLSVAAHQLRTPMAGIRWASQMLYDGDMGKLNEEQKHHLGAGLDNINRMIKLINDLLDVTKIEEQKFNYTFVKSDITLAVQEIIDRLQDQANAKKVKVTLDAPKTSLLIEFDKEKMDMALNNLLDNAIKYSKPSGHVDISIKKSKDGIECTVQDDGIGIPDKSQNEVFTKFFRAPNAMKVFADGSGLGLYMLQDIIHKHEGNISFKSKEGEGTSFTFYLPKTQLISKNNIKAKMLVSDENQTEKKSTDDSENSESTEEKVEEES